LRSVIFLRVLSRVFQDDVGHAGTKGGGFVPFVAPVYSTDPGDPWNRIFHLLYARKLRAQVGPPENSKAPWRSITRLEGGDIPEFFFPPDAGYLVEEPRRSRLRSSLEAEISSPTLRGRTPEARILFQQDLWNRFDALHALAAKDSRAMPLARLLARLMATVALTKDELAGMRPSFAEAAQERPDLLDPGLFGADSRWSELVSYFDVGPGAEPGGGTTMHARRAGWRLVFRRFVRVPPEAGAQVRVTRPGGGFTVLHAPRLALSASPRRLVLEPLGEKDLVPQTSSVFPRYGGQPLVRVPQSCVLCHGPDGGRLGTASLISPPRTEVLAPANRVEEDRVLRAKRESDSFRALLTFLREP